MYTIKETSIEDGSEFVKYNKMSMSFEALCSYYRQILYRGSRIDFLGARYVNTLPKTPKELIEALNNAGWNISIPKEECVSYELLEGSNDVPSNYMLFLIFGLGLGVGSFLTSVLIWIITG